MAANLLSSGTSVAAFDLSKSSLDAVSSLGGTAVSSVEDLKECETIITMLPSSPHVQETVDKLLDAGWRGKVRWPSRWAQSRWVQSRWAQSRWALTWKRVKGSEGTIQCALQDTIVIREDTIEDTIEDKIEDTIITSEGTDVREQVVEEPAVGYVWLIQKNV